MRRHLWSGLGGICLGSFVAYYYLSFRHSKSDYNVDLLASNGGRVSPYQGEMDDHARSILKYGLPGPIVDLLIRDAYVASFNRQSRNPHWVAEHLTRDSLDGKGADRSKFTFKEDPAIPPLFRSKLADYEGSGFDRGHLIPCANIKSESVKETFFLTNISPQVGKGFNRGYWLHFESFVRSLTKKFDHIYVITGPLFLPKQDESDGKYYVRYQVIGNPPNTAVPAHFFKVILVEKGDQVAMGGFVLPNEEIESKSLSEFIVPVEAIEKASGLEMFPLLREKKQTKHLCLVESCEVQHQQFNQLMKKKKA